jgi:hypothetical protein
LVSDTDGVLLNQVVHHDTPFACFTVGRAFDRARLEALDALFELDHAWEHHHGGFYECFMAEVGPRLPRDWVTALVARMSGLSGLPLHPHVGATVQRMEHGQQARVHTDRPLLGFEALRLVVQLKDDWRPGDGGVFRAHGSSAEHPVVWSRPPRRNQAVGFQMGPSSFHSVTPVCGVRRTVVFNFWHVANPPALAGKVRGLFEGCRFDLLGDEIDALAMDAEGAHDEEVTYMAGLVAWVLRQWALPAPVWALGYRQALAAPPPWEGGEPLSGDAAAVALARWVAWLHAEDVRLDWWSVLQRRLAGARLEGPAGDWLRRCVPTGDAT